MAEIKIGKIVQITTGDYSDSNSLLFALDEYGNLWMKPLSTPASHAKQWTRVEGPNAHNI